MRRRFGGAPARFRRRARPTRSAAPAGPARGPGIRARPAGCAENRPKCIFGREFDRHCAEKRAKCISRQELPSSQRMRSSCGRVPASSETAGHEGDIVFLRVTAGAIRARTPPPRRRNRGAREYTLAVFQHIDPFRAAGKYILPVFQHIFSVRRGSGGTAPHPTSGRRPPRTHPRTGCARRPVAAVSPQRALGQNSCSPEGGITESALLWSKPVFTGGKSRGSAANFCSRAARTCVDRSKTPAQKTASRSVVKTCVFCTYSESQF